MADKVPVRCEEGPPLKPRHRLVIVDRPEIGLKEVLKPDVLGLDASQPDNLILFRPCGRNADGTYSLETVCFPGAVVVERELPGGGGTYAQIIPRPVLRRPEICEIRSAHPAEPEPAPQASVVVTFFSDYAAKTKREERLSLTALRELIRTTSAPSKEALPWLKFTRFGDRGNGRSGSLRSNSNVLAITGVVCDYDGEKVGLDEAVARIKRAGITALLYTSPSYTEAAPRWRVCCPCSAELPPDQHDQLVARVNGTLGDILAGESFVLSQAYYYGSVTGRPAPRVEIVNGERYLDEADDLDDGAAGKRNGRGDRHNHASGPPQAPIGDIVAAVALIPNDDLEWDDWNRLGMAIWRASGGSPEGFEAFDGLSQKSKKYDADETRYKWHRYYFSPPDSIGFGTLHYEARQVEPGWEPPSRRSGNGAANRADREAVVRRKIAEMRQCCVDYINERNAALRADPDLVGLSDAEFGRLWDEMDEARPKGASDNGAADAGDTIAGLGVWNAGDDPEFIEPRGWLLGKSFCRDFLSGLTGAGAVGKTALRYVQYISVSWGRSLTGEYVHHRARVLIICLEDNRTEMQRRIRAACIHHKVPRKELDGWLFYWNPKGSKLLEIGRHGEAAKGKMVAELRAIIQKLQIDIVGLDPFIKAHDADENDNKAIDAVATVLMEIGSDFHSSMDYLHHHRKSMTDLPGQADSGRGGGALKDAGRLVYTATSMAKSEAKMFGLREAERRLLLRYDQAKVNLAPPSAETMWFKLVGVPLGNRTDAYPGGDEVQTVERWYPPDVWTALTEDVIHAVLDQIERGPDPEGARYSAAPQAGEKRAAWRVVKSACSKLSDEQAKKVITQWLESGVLEERLYTDPVDRHDKKGLFVINRPGAGVEY